jgi:apolipoprotein N-acyltransferase
MDFVHKHPFLAAAFAVFTTAGLLLAGDGMNPVWPLMWIAFLPVLLLAAETTSWLLAAASAALSMVLGSLTLLYYLHFVLHAPVTAWLIPISIASVLFAAGVLLFRGLLQRGAVFSALIALPAFWAVVEYRSLVLGVSPSCCCYFPRQLRLEFIFRAGSYRIEGSSWDLPLLS